MSTGGGVCVIGSGNLFSGEQNVKSSQVLKPKDTFLSLLLLLLLFFLLLLLLVVLVVLALSIKKNL